MEHVVSINERMTAGKVFLNYLKSLCETSEFVNIVAYKNRNRIDEKYFTEEDFICVEESKKSGICDDITSLENLLKSKK